MAALFALGAMSLAWMIVVAILIAVEKMLPWRAAATVGVAAILVGLAIGVAAAPGRVPGLTVPSDHHGMGMDRMNGQGKSMDRMNGQGTGTDGMTGKP
jgi:membrane protein implicated in regulation of membrane protease activity